VGEMRVDLDELDDTVRKLNRVAAAMGKSSSSTKYKTYLPAGALGQGFAEQTDLDSAHAEMKTTIEEIADAIEKMVESFKEKTKTVHGKIQDAEAEAKHGMDSGTTGQ
jgi:ribosome-associated translation inhibitor RaiA